jgi:hypothetical protein
MFAPFQINFGRFANDVVPKTIHDDKKE